MPCLGAAGTSGTVLVAQMGQLVPGRVAGGGKTLSYVWSVLTSQPKAGVAVGARGGTQLAAALPALCVGLPLLPAERGHWSRVMELVLCPLLPL